MPSRLTEDPEALTNVWTDVCSGCGYTHEGVGPRRLLHGELGRNFEVLTRYVVAEREFGLLDHGQPCPAAAPRIRMANRPRVARTDVEF